MPAFARLLGLAMTLLLAVPALPARAGARRNRPCEGSLKVGDPAPDFTLKQLDGKGTVALSSLRGKRPVVLVFGSYT
ncbi:redoxin domain-containing protein [bacterium]|nr:redoxin domain-containing protein [bacterium]